MSYRYYNTLEIIGDEKQIQTLKEFIRGGQDEKGQEIYFDFNKVEKMPENISDDYNDVVIKYPHPELNPDLNVMNIWDETLGRYYNWCYENWGCKYHPFGQEMKEENIIRYTTVNGQALSVIKKLSTLFPEVILVVESLCDSPDDEIYHYKNGEIVKFIDYDYFVTSTLFFRVHGRIQSKIESELFEHFMHVEGKSVNIKD